MNPGIISISLHNQYEYQERCYDRSIAILEQALTIEGKTPKLEHHITLLRNEIFSIPFSIIQRIITIAGHIFDYIPSHIYARICGSGTTSDMFKKIFGHVCHITVLNPLYVLTGVVVKAIRIGSAAIGIVTPKKAIKGWQLAFKVDKSILHIFSKMWKWLIPRSLSDDIDWKYINPVLADSYLRGTSIELQKTLLANSELKKREKTFRTSVSNYFKTLNDYALLKNKNNPIWLELQQLKMAPSYLIMLQPDAKGTLHDFTSVIQDHLLESGIWDIKIVDHLYGCLNRLRLEKFPLPSDTDDKPHEHDRTTFEKMETDLKYLSEVKDGKILTKYHRL